jgi:hypothetical protein
MLTKFRRQRVFHLYWLAPDQDAVIGSHEAEVDNLALLVHVLQ